nr:phospholipase-like protein [Tanacetum cinerariifolium]
MILEQEKNIIEEPRFRVEEAKRMRLEEDKLLQIVELKKRRHEFMNSTHVKSILGKLTHSKRNYVEIYIQKTHEMVNYMWHGRPDNANWAMVSCYFAHILLQNSTPLFYASGDKYATPWIDVDQRHV